jgi:hypothetical protein
LKHSAGNAVGAMNIALVTLCIGAVFFLTSVLIALVQEAFRWPRHRESADLARFTLSQARGKLLVLKAEAPRKHAFPRRAANG